jgi:hypothetical protein
LFVEVFFVFIVRVLYDRVGNVGFWFCHNERELSEARREREREREGLGGEDLRAYRYFFKYFLIKNIEIILFLLY